MHIVVLHFSFDYLWLQVSEPLHRFRRLHFHFQAKVLASDHIGVFYWLIFLINIAVEVDCRNWNDVFRSPALSGLYNQVEILLHSH